MFVAVRFAIVHAKSEKSDCTFGRLFANFQFCSLGTSTEPKETDIFSCPTKPPTEVSERLARILAETGMPFHVTLENSGGAMTVSVVLPFKSPLIANVEPEMVALRTR